MKKSIIAVLLVISIVVVAFGFYNYNHKKKVAGESIDLEKMPIKGLIMPHHELAKEIIIKSIDKLSSSNKYSLIVILSPNHYNPKSYTFTTSFDVKNFTIAKNYLQSLKEFDQDLVFDRVSIENDQGAVVPMQYLSNYYPNAVFLPILVSPYYSEKKLDEFSSWMVKHLPADTLFVSSADFSHENMYAKAHDLNGESIEVIKNFDYQKLFAFVNDNNQHLDSPIGTAILLKTMEQLKTTNWQTWYDSHGAELTDKPVLQGTSYVIGVFR